MRQITKLTDDASQRFTLVGENGEDIGFSVRFLSTQQQWVFDVSIGDFVLTGVQLVMSPNLLRGYKNLLNFGIMCQSTDGEDPFYINDFITGRITLFLLTAAEVEQIELNLFT